MQRTTMVIGIDGNEANVAHRVGVSMYTHALLTEFQKVATTETQFVVYLRTPPLPHMPPATQFFTYRRVWGPTAWRTVFLPLQLHVKKEVDVFFAPAHYAPAFCPVPLVVTIHDLSYKYFPDEFIPKDLYKLEHWTEEALHSAKTIIAVSETTKSDIIKWYPHTQVKTQVILNGFQSQITDSSKPLSEIHPTLTEKNYLLFVGTIQPRKNIQLLVEAFSTLAQANPNMHLVIVGKKGWLAQPLYDYVATLPANITNRIIMTGYLPDEDVSVLYKHALCCVVPGKYEGFGIPILEAMAHGCPVIASNGGALPETGGDACLYFNPDSPQDLVKAVNVLVSNDATRTSFIEKGLAHSTQFSWQTCAEKTLKILTMI